MLMTQQLVWQTTTMACAGSASGIVLAFGMAPHTMTRKSRLFYSSIGASLGALIGIFYALKGRPLLL